MDIPIDSIGIYGEKFDTEKSCLPVFPTLSPQNCKKFSILPEKAMSGEPLRYRMAKVEFLGCWEKTQSMLAQGFSKRIVYEKLLEEKRLSMAYVTFCKLSAKAAQSSLLPTAPQQNTAPAPIKTVAPLPTARQDAQPGPRIINATKEPFPDPREMNPEEAI